MSIRLITYTPDWRDRWDDFVERSKNGTLLFRRGFMEYHADRFADASLIVVDDAGNIEALLPASRHGDELRSHGGLTYGGWVMGDRTSGAAPMQWFEALTDYCRQCGITAVLYKPVPHIYHRIPAEEDLYALFRAGARIEVCNLATVIDMRQPMRASRLTSRARKRARRYGITVERVASPSSFWQIIVDDRRERHNAAPVHSIDEIELLCSRFRDEIRCYEARCDGELVAGAVVFVTAGVIHLQYAAANDVGKECYAVDVIYNYLIFEELSDCRYFDFGTSNEDAGRYLNKGMVAHKEEFGGRSVVYQIYKLQI